jgi:hypothetical protein
MNAEDPLRALAALPRPRLSPFFSARVTARATSEPGATPRAASRLMRLYWLVLLVVAVSVLARTWIGFAALALAGVLLAFPLGTVRLLLTVVVGAARKR